tara:strand:+ start:706 stop:975 length:270 start_codon:yes stop_codon:yes gene_type:complete
MVAKAVVIAQKIVINLMKVLRKYLVKKDTKERKWIQRNAKTIVQKLYKNGCAMQKSPIAHPPLYHAFLQGLGGCAVVQLHMPAHTHMHG